MAEEYSNPRQNPPASLTAAGDSDSPERSIPEESLSSSESGASLDAPAQDPPATLSAESGEEAFGAGSWYNGKKITALWTINQPRNSWAGVSGLGWRKISSANDSSSVALTQLAAHAKDRNRNVNVRVDNNQIVEIYVW